MYYRFFCGNLGDSDDLYDSDDYDTEYEEEDSFEALCRFESQNTPSISSNSLDSLLKQIEYPTPHEEVESNQEEEEGIPDLVSDENGYLPPAAQVECPQSSENQEHSDNGGGELSVFTNLASESEGQAAEAGLPACNLKVSTPPTPQVGKLTPYPLSVVESLPLVWLSSTYNGLISKNIVTKLPELGGVQNLVPRLEWLGKVYLEAHPLLS